jgi:hypothetical protein
MCGAVGSAARRINCSVPWNAMQVAAGSWILEVTPAAPARPRARPDETPQLPPPRAADRIAPPPYPRGLLIDLVV